MKSGALGGKISGAGGGGFMYFLCKPELQKNIFRNIPKLQYIETNLSKKGSEIIYEQ
jgi:D-glycero-alpha-D-manno-heptose-7-phosphate kinase